MLSAKVRTGRRDRILLESRAFFSPLRSLSAVRRVHSEPFVLDLLEMNSRIIKDDFEPKFAH